MCELGSVMSSGFRCRPGCCGVVVLCLVESEQHGEKAYGLLYTRSTDFTALSSREREGECECVVSHRSIPTQG